MAKPPAYVYVIDYSGSTEGVRKRYLGLIVQELETAPAETEVVIYRVGRETQEVFSGRLGDEGADALAGVIKRDLMALDRKKGTDFAKMAEALATFSKRFKGDTYKLRIMTDGGNDFADPSDLSMMRREIGVVMNDRLLSSPLLYGVLPPFRRSMREAFGDRAGQLRGIWENSRMALRRRTHLLGRWVVPTAAGLVQRIAIRKILPRCSRAHHPHDPAHHFPRRAKGTATTALRNPKQSLDHSPLLIRHVHP